MAGRFAANYAAALLEFLEHVTIADACAMELYVVLFERVFQAQVAHNGPNDRPVQPAFLLPRGCQDVQDLVSVDEQSVLVDEHHAITVTVRRHSGHRELQQVGPGRSAAVVDIASVGRATDRDDFRIEIRKRARPDLVTRPVGTVEDHLHAVQVDALRERGRAESLVAHECGIDALRLAERL